MPSSKAKNKKARKMDPLREIAEERRSHRNLSVLNFENIEHHKHVRVEHDVSWAKLYLRLLSINTSASHGPSPPLLFICNTDVYSSGQIEPTSGLHPTILQSDHCLLHSKVIYFPSVLRFSCNILTQ